jgi:hypothetical protein
MFDFIDCRLLCGSFRLGIIRGNYLDRGDQYFSAYSPFDGRQHTVGYRFNTILVFRYRPKQPATTTGGNIVYASGYRLKI